MRRVFAMNELLLTRGDVPDLASSRARVRGVRPSGVARRWAIAALVALVGCIGVLATLVPVAAAANHSYPATYSGTVAGGGTVTFDVSADGVYVTRFAFVNVPVPCVLLTISATITFTTGTAITNDAFSAGAQHAM